MKPPIALLPRLLYYAEHYEKFWSMLSALAALAATGAALFAVLQAVQAGRESASQRRPYFKIDNLSIKQGPGIYRFFFMLTNVGIHPASKLRVRINMWSVGGKEHLALGDYTAANDIPANAPNDTESKDLQHFEEMPTSFLLVRVNYLDPIAKHDFSQNIYIKWEGKHSGQPYGRLFHASSEEAAKIDGFLSALSAPPREK